MLPSAHRVLCTLNSSVARFEPASNENSAPTALSTAARCCRRRVRCTLHTSVTHIKCARLTPEASAQPPSALQPYAAVAALGAIHTQHERGSLQMHQPPARSRRPAALSIADQCCSRRATRPRQERDSHQVPSCPQRCSECCYLRTESAAHFDMSATHLECTSLTRSARPSLQRERDSLRVSALHEVHSTHEKPVA